MTSLDITPPTSSGWTPLGRFRWTSDRHGQLPIDGRAQLDLAAALDGLAAAYVRTVPGTRVDP